MHRSSTTQEAVDEHPAEPADALTDRYDTYHLRMWLIYDPTKNCPAAHPGTVAPTSNVCGPADRRKHVAVEERIYMTSAHEPLNSERSPAGKQHPAHRRLPHAVAFSREVPVKAA